ncbi:MULTISPECIES: HNH endonuclease [unclassified Rhodococcus (in: high G+C Gram-positive bacteria)]|uniref:HNH endonuclease n=1 Tax=unclassified Rhodococcus (in: high G+C Gram-positive bacteria) TaxID=192944 RepID=UPI000B9AD1FC|nr:MULTISPECIES: HNH endonuclease signature motif containing protein [unclassified Rhodococcus (in: high G+C Gram-positive bacteria)]OZE36157.1 HNH endonuclease [Rhodococcus sp. 05-2254-4]OZE41204.1 HNH endonuclease [Rhodococcus sp. 05-2254-3]OZE44551.1 HNH endonuclease [Rhodococcus sp. 05-2254-2]
MSIPSPADPLTLGQHLVSVLDTGARVATYKLAVLVALLEFSVENVPDYHSSAVDVDLDDLAARVVGLYWRQVRDFDGHYLRQSTQARATIPDAVREFARATATAGRETPLDIASRRNPDLFREMIKKVKLVLATQPLYRLQRVPGGYAGESFLYDDSWMSAKMGMTTVLAHGNRITLYPGVCFALARLSALLKPALMLAWVDDVRRKNSFLDEDVPDLEGHLFGNSRIALIRPRAALIQAFGPSCFYCSTRVGPEAHVDHVLPWSRVGIDGLANLVLACPSCNTSKSQLLPARPHVLRALDRGRDSITELAATIDWPVQFDRVVTSARGLYASQPVGSPIWLGRNKITDLRVDFSWLQGYHIDLSNNFDHQ